MKAWVTLLTQPNYLAGVRTLRASLERSGTRHPLVVLVTDGIDADTRQLLEDDGCQVRGVDSLRPGSDGPDHYANARFAEVWTKLAAWQLTEFDRVVFLDADMLVTQNMDELFSLEIVGDAIAACHACRCNPNRIASYPASWSPENCFYSYCRGADHTSEPGVVDDYLNAGFLVLTPDKAVFKDMAEKLAELDDLASYPFAEQDFLNEYYRERWYPLPYVYNALKTLEFQHPAMFDAAAVKNIHYIIDKPWEKAPDPDDRYYPVNRLWWDVATDASTAPPTLAQHSPSR
jgi:alpha-N-acetylglucosamine transferase